LKLRDGVQFAEQVPPFSALKKSGSIEAVTIRVSRNCIDAIFRFEKKRLH